MSIAKAGLVFYYSKENPFKSWDWGEIEIAHKIVDIAGANHASFFTSVEVFACLRNSPYWNKELIYNYYPGFRGGGHACKLTPSEKGENYYKKFLKKTLCPNPIR